MNWILLILAGFFEVCWAAGMKSSHGFTHAGPAVFTVVTMLASVALLSFAMRTLPLGTAYAVWTGIGAVGSVIAGIVLFGESASVPRLLCLALIVCGIIGLKLIPAK